MWNPCACPLLNTKNYKCIVCKSPIVGIANNTGLEEYDGDWIYYCANKGCPNHKGETIWQDHPDWVITDD